VEKLCFIRGPCREVISGIRLERSSVRESVRNGFEPGGRGIAIVEAVTRKRLVTNRTIDCVL
jgi:hypothetical protein